jgi:putative sterol carrier protein
MTDATTEFFTELGERRHEPALERMTGTVRFDLRGDGGTTRWLVAIEKGDVAVSRKNVKADCVVRADKASFDRIASGEANPFAAVLRGAMRVEGDAKLIISFQRLFPAPPRKGS